MLDSYPARLYYLFLELIGKVETVFDIPFVPTGANCRILLK